VAPRISVIARDRGGGYALAAAKALPNAIQVADRWHLMENASRAFLDAVQKSMRQIRAAIGAKTINPGLLTAAERIQYEGYLRREEANAAILGLAKHGVSIREIVRRNGHSRGSFATCCAVGARMSFAPGRVRSNRIFNGSTRNGPQAFVTARSYGGTSSGKGPRVAAGRHRMG
jgi:hypothetical protein